jgi:hypothetical protein
MIITSICGFIQINFSKIKIKKLFHKYKRNGSRAMSITSSIMSLRSRNNKNQTVCMSRFHFWRDMIIVGALRLVKIK